MVGTRGPVPVPLQNGDGNRDLTLQILKAVDQHDAVETATEFPTTPQAVVKAALDRLASRLMVEYEQNTAEQTVLTAEGQQIADEGSYEYRAFEAVRQAGKLSPKDLMVCFFSMPLCSAESAELIGLVFVGRLSISENRTE